MYKITYYPPTVNNVASYWLVASYTVCRYPDRIAFLANDKLIVLCGNWTVEEQ